MRDVFSDSLALLRLSPSPGHWLRAAAGNSRIAFFVACGAMLLALLWMPGAAQAQVTAPGIIIELETNPASTASFGFVGVVNTPFALQHDQRREFSDLTPGEYVVWQMETNADYDLIAIECDESVAEGTASQVDVASHMATINLDPDEIVRCRFVNNMRGQIVIVQATNPTDATLDPFTYSLTGSTNFELSVGETHTVTALKSGEYVVTQTGGDENWLLDSITCDDGDSAQPSVVDRATGRAAIKLEAGETVTCTFENEAPALVITESFAGIDLAEATGASYGGVACYWLTLGSRPNQPVTVSIDADAQIQTNKQSVVLDATNWDKLDALDVAAANRVCVTPIDDRIDDGDTTLCAAGNSMLLGTGGVPIELCGDHLGIIEHTVMTTDTVYSLAALPVRHLGLNLDNDPMTVDVLLQNDDIAVVNIRESEGASVVTEGSSAIAGYWLSLASQPVANVTISITTDSQVKTNLTAVEFTPGTWNVEQMVRIASVDDDVVEGTHVGLVGHTASSTDPAYNDPGVSYAGNGASQDPRFIQVAVTDDDIAAFSVFPTSLSVLEGSTVSYTIQLDSRPTAPVTVSVGVSHTVGISNTLLALRATSYLFTPESWNVPQAVAVRAVENAAYTGPVSVRLHHRATSAGTPYDGLIGDEVAVLVVDNDSGGVNIVPSVVDVAEGGAIATYQIGLTGPPVAPVVVSLDGGDQVDVTPNVLTFLPANWQTPGLITVTAIDDEIAEGLNGAPHIATIRHFVNSQDPAFDDILAGVVTVNIGDNDRAGVAVSAGQLQLREGDATGAGGNYTVHLDSQPLQDVTVTLQAEAGLTVLPSTLFFGAENWSIPQVVQVVVIDDSVDRTLLLDSYAIEISHLFTSADPRYNGLDAPSVVVTVVEDDQAGIVFDTHELALTEDGVADSFVISLTSQPQATLELLIAPDGQTMTLPTRLVFTADNWNRPAAVVVRALDDAVDESTLPFTHSSRIELAALSADANYGGRELAPIHARITDNDTAGLVFTARQLNVFENGPGGMDIGSYGVRLAAVPPGTVTVRILTGKQVHVVGSDTLIFTPDNWMTSQLVVVQAVNDEIAEGLHTTQLQHQYLDGPVGDELLNAVVQVNIADDDSAGVHVTPGVLVARSTLAANPAELFYTVRLTAQPTSPIDILATAPTGLTVGDHPTHTLSFDTDNWQIAQVVTVAVNPSLGVTSAPILEIVHSISTLDDDYAGQVIPAVWVVMRDVFRQSDPDNDGLVTVVEDLNGDDDPTNDDTDGDTIPNYLDEDDDGDGLLTKDEDPNGDDDPTNDDTDGDLIPNYLDDDDDGDGFKTTVEDLDQNGDPTDDDTDGDLIPNFLDADDDGDDIPSAVEGDGDDDGDGIPNYLDAIFNVQTRPLFLPFVTTR